MQMLAHYTIGDFNKFKTAFDNDSEDRSNNSISVLQVWRETDGSAWVLFDVHNSARAKSYLEGAAGVFNSLAGVTQAEFHMLETA